MDPDKEGPIESTFVRIKETPPEQESKVLLLTENGEQPYTVNHATSHPPPTKVFVCDQPESARGFSLGGVSSRALSDSSTDFMHQIINQVLQGSTPGKTNNVSEPAPESSILSTRKEGRRSNSLPIKKTVHFEADTYKDASCSNDPFYGPDLSFEESLRATQELPKQDEHASSVQAQVAQEKKPKQEAAPVAGAASPRVPGDLPGADGALGHAQPSQHPSPCDSAVEGPTGHSQEGHSLPHPGDNTVLADAHEIVVPLQTVEAVDKEDYFEGIPLKASKFNSDLVDFASTSQAFPEAASPQERTPAEEVASEAPAEKLGKKRGKSAHTGRESPEPQVKRDRHEPPPGPEQEAQGYSLAPEEPLVEKKPEVYEKAKRKSSRGRREEEGEADLAGVGGELPSNPPSGSVSLETLRSHSEEGLELKPSPPLSKISVIPHDLFYYPHYEVPLAAVLEAYAEGTEDLKGEDADLEEPDGYPHELDPRNREAAGAQSSCSLSALAGVLPSASTHASYVNGNATGAMPAAEPAPLPPDKDHQPRETKESDPVESHQVLDHGLGSPGPCPGPFCTSSSIKWVRSPSRGHPGALNQGAALL